MALLAHIALKKMPPQADRTSHRMDPPSFLAANHTLGSGIA
jgi:hypothetical protein